MVKDLDTNDPIDAPDTGMQFYLSGHSGDREAILSALCKSWDGFSNRFNIPEGDWISGLSGYLETITQMRATHVQKWVYQNLGRFKASHASLETLKRACDTALVELKENVHLCKAQCSSCNLQCLQSRGHETQHDCQTSHYCPHPCGFSDEHPGEEKKCGFRHVILHNELFPANPFSVLDIQDSMCMPQNSLYNITVFTYPFLGVLLTFTYVESLVNSGARKGVRISVPRFEHTYTHPSQAPNYSLLAFRP